LSVPLEAAGKLHVDLLHGPDGPAAMVVISRAEAPQTVVLGGEGKWRGLFGGEEWQLPGAVTVEGVMAELWVRGER